jgi:hypothetical protein
MVPPWALPVIAAAGVWLALWVIAVRPAAWSWTGGRLTWMLSPLFHDWHVVYRGWTETVAGHDALADPASPFNYPRIVLWFADWGLRLSPMTSGLALAALFLGTLALALRPRSWLAGTVFAVLLLSFPVLLMVERGNLDQIAFILVVAGLLGLARDRSGPVAQAAGAGAILLAGVVKLYPLIIPAVAIFYWRDSRRRWLVATLIAAGGWVLLHLEEIALVMRKTTRGLEPAYGRLLLTGRLQAEGVWGLTQADAHSCGLVGLALSLAAMLTGWWLGVRHRREISVAMPGAVDRALCLAGALIYTGTYMLGSNWSYRLVFLLICVPGLWTIAGGAGRVRWAARVALGAIVLSCFGPVHLSVVAFVGLQLVQLALMGLLAGVAAALLGQGAPAAAVSAERPAV